MKKKLGIILFSSLALCLASACVSIPLVLSYLEEEVSVPAPEGFFPSFHYNVSMKWKRKREEKKDVIVSYRLFACSDEEVMKTYGNKKVEFTLSRVFHDEKEAKKNSLVLERCSLLFSELVDLKGDGTFIDTVSASDFDGASRGRISYVASVLLDEETLPSTEDALGDFLCDGESHSCLYDIRNGGIYIEKPEIPKNVNY